MATENFIRSMDQLNLNRAGSDCLPFHPHERETWLNDNFQKVPQYLFRVSFHRKSDGETTKVWAKSKDAKEGNPNQGTNILDGDRADMADMLWRHLRWKGGSPSNLLSWTSSLLFALQYIFYRHHMDRVALEDITLFIIDTAQFPKEAFARDMDLISIFSKFDSRLRDLRGLRTKNTSHSSKCYYFGEYLSQGALKIEGKCGSATAKEIIDKRLFYLRAEFKDSLNVEMEWANRVLKLRRCFIGVEVGDEKKENLELQVALAFGIGSLFGSSWAPPIAASLLGLRPRSAGDVDIICKESMKFAAGWNGLYYESNADLRALPDVKQFETIMLALTESIHLRYLLDQIRTASMSLTYALDRHTALLGNGALSASDTKLSRKMIGEYLGQISKINSALLKEFPRAD